MSAHVAGCTWDEGTKRYTVMGEGCAAREEHAPAAEPTSSEPAVEPLTSAQAKARVARGVSGMLDQVIAAGAAQLEALPDGVAKENERKMVQEAQALRSILLVTARKLERPGIMKPRRSMRVVRN
jgi:hypothetical protein